MRPLVDRAHYAAIELDEEIPLEHYKAVVEVIGHVMRLWGELSTQRLTIAVAVTDLSIEMTKKIGSMVTGDTFGGPGFSDFGRWVVRWRAPLLWASVPVFLLACSGMVLWIGIPGQHAGFIGGGVLLAVLAMTAAVMTSWRVGARHGEDSIGGLMRLAAEGAPEPVLLTGPDGAGLFANHAFRQCLDLADNAPAGFDSLLTRLHDRPRWEKTVTDLYSRAAGGEAIEAEIPIAAAVGARWLRLSATPVAGASGHVAWQAEDVTEQRRGDAADRRTRNTLSDYVKNLPVGFFSSDSAGRFLYANRALARWLGSTPEALCRDGVRFADFVVAEGSRDGPAVGDLFSAHRGGGDGDIVLRGHKGVPFRAHLVQSELAGSDGAISHTRSLVMRDLTRIEGDPGAPSPLQRLRWLFDQAPVGVVMVDLQGNVSDCNRAFLKLIGLHRDAVVDHPLTDRVSLEDRGAVAAQLSKVVMGTMRAARLEARMPGVGGDVVASLYASHTEDVEGEVAGLVVHFIDTTEQKHLEAQFAQSQKMQAVGQLAGGVAHDFNNLLTAMIGFSDLLLERHGPEDPSFADIMQIKQNANRATNLVRQLLAFSRKQTLKPVFVDITGALSDMSSLLRRLMGENLKLVMEHGEELGYVRVDPGQMDQVIINLAVNSRDAMPGGGTLTLRTSRLRFDETVERGAELIPAGDYVMVEVADTGVGIRKENMGMIFEPFFSTKEAGAGTGLGLSTVYGIIKQTEGYIVVDSTPGEGTTFRIYLPRYEPSGAESVADSIGAGEAKIGISGWDGDADLSGAGTVLLVEDEDAVRLFGARALRNKGYRVLEAANGELALDVINAGNRHIDLIISDVVMPGMDGQAFVKLVRQELPRVRVILMSGYAEDVVSDDIWNDPTIHFLPKPFTLHGLATKVKDVMAEG